MTLHSNNWQRNHSCSWQALAMSTPASIGAAASTAPGFFEARLECCWCQCCHWCLLLVAASHCPRLHGYKGSVAIFVAFCFFFLCPGLYGYKGSMASVFR